MTLCLITFLHSSRGSGGGSSTFACSTASATATGSSSTGSGGGEKCSNGGFCSLYRLKACARRPALLDGRKFVRRTVVLLTEWCLVSCSVDCDAFFP